LPFPILPIIISLAAAGIYTLDESKFSRRRYGDGQNLLRNQNAILKTKLSEPAAVGIDLFYTDCINIVRWKRRPNMLLMNTMSWIVFGVVVVILAVFIGKKIKDRYF